MTTVLHALRNVREADVTIAILGVLAMMAVPMLEVTAQRQKETQLRAGLREIRTAIDAYRQAVLDKKIQVAADASGYPPDLEALARGVPDITRPDTRPIYFLRRVPSDPITESSDTWLLETPPEGASANGADGVYNLHSGAKGVGSDGKAYSEL